MSTLVEHWRRLEGAVHPDDARLFVSHPHTFNLDWPPPAYVGDVDNAPVVLLMMNGGYNPSMTPREFEADGAVDRYLDMLRNPRPINPKEVSPYYDAGSYGSYIASGRLALVNAVAYRSPGLNGEPDNKRLAKLLPSTLVHLKWLRQELIPQAIAGERVVVAHRNRMWKLGRHEFDHPNIVFTTNPISPYPSADLMRRILAG